MNRITPIFLAVCSTYAAGCRPPDRTSSARSPAALKAVVLDFQSGFDRTPVELQVDQKLVLSEVLTTDEVVGLARSITLTPRDPARIDAEILVDHTAHYAYHLQLDRGRFIGFSKNLDSGQLQMEQSPRPFEYD